MNSRQLTAVPSDKSASVVPSLDARVVVEEMACAIAEAQAALFAGRLPDLESSITRLQTFCASLKNIESPKLRAAARDPQLLGAARHAHSQNRLFAAVLRKTRRHLESLRTLIGGPSLTYQPKAVDISVEES